MRLVPWRIGLRGMWVAALLLIVSSVLVLSGCLGVDEPAAEGTGAGASDGSSQLPSALPGPGLISSQEGYDILVALSEDPGFILLDIRTAPEVESLHIPGAVNLDFYADEFSEQLAELDRDKTYLIYCRTANRTGQAYDLMSDLGFEHVWDLDGGISTWSGLGYPTCQGALGSAHDCSGNIAFLSGFPEQFTP